MGSVVHNAALDDLLGRPKVDADRTAVMLLKRIADPGSGSCSSPGRSWRR
jgi:hypothetical protein